MPACKHWQNRPTSDRPMFITTTCLGYARLFARPEMRERLVALVSADCRHYGATLHGICVMPHHLHMVILTPAEHSPSWFMRRLKSNTAKDLLPLLTAKEREAMGSEREGQGRQFWKISFRGIPIFNERAFLGDDQVRPPKSDPLGIVCTDGRLPLVFGPVVRGMQMVG